MDKQECELIQKTMDGLVSELKVRDKILEDIGKIMGKENFKELLRLIKADWQKTKREEVELSLLDKVTE